MKIQRRIKCIFLVLLIIIAISPISAHNIILVEADGDLKTLNPDIQIFQEDFLDYTYMDKKNTDVFGWGETIGEIGNSRQDPTLIGFCDMPNMVLDVFVSNNYAYITDQYDGLRVVDVADPSNPILIGLCSIPDWASEVFVSGDFAYVVQIELIWWGIDYIVCTLHIVDINPTSPNYLQIIGTCHTLEEHGEDIWTCGIYLSGDHAYITFGYYLYIIDISDPVNPTLVGSLNNLKDYGSQIYVSGDYAYVATWRSLDIIDISDPVNPIRVSSLITLTLFDIYVSDIYAYAAKAGVGLYVFDISDPNNPSEISRCSVPRYTLFRIQVSGSYAFLGGQDRGSFHVVDISNPSEPVWIASLSSQIPHYLWDFYILNGYAYLTAPRKGLYIAKISDIDFYKSQCHAQSKKINSPGYIESATLISEDNIPANTEIKYYLSADGGVHWENVIPDINHNFIYPGFDLRWKAVLSTNEDLITPSINKIIINFALDEPPTMDPIIEPEFQEYSSAPIFSHLGFNDDVALDDGCFQIDSYEGTWVPLFTDLNDIEWNYDGWLLLGFDDLSEGLHQIYFKVTDIVGNEVGEEGECKWSFYKIIGDSTPPIIIINYIDGDQTDGNSGKWNVFAYDDESGINEDTINVLIDGEFAGDVLGDYFVPNSLGEHTIYVEVENHDAILGSESESVTIIDDDTKYPDINYYYTGDGTDGNPGEIVVTASDDSGLFIDPTGSYFVPNSLGTHIFVFTAIDNDNDRVDDALTMTVQIEINIIDDDVTPPEIYIDYTGSGLDNNPGYFEWNVFDLDSGISEINITISYESTEGLDDYVINLEGTGAGTWNLQPNLGIYTIEISVRDNDNDRTLIVDSLTTELTRDQEILDDDVESPELSNLIIIPDLFEINVTFNAIDESGIGDISTFVNGELVEPITQIQYGNTYSFIFENQWLFQSGVSEVVIQVEDGDDDRPNDVLTSFINGTFENVLYPTYEYIIWHLEELKNYIDENLCHRVVRSLNRKLSKAQDHLYEAFNYFEDGSITCALFHDYLAKLFIRFAEHRTEIFNRKGLIEDYHAEYIIDSLHEIRNNIVLLMGASTGEEQAYEITLIEVELLNLKDFIEDEIPCCIGRCLSAKISCSAKLLELALFEISKGYSIDCILEYTQCKLEHAITKINFLLEKGKISEDVANYLIEKISSIIGDIEQIKNN